MPQASCDTCKQSIYGTDILLCSCTSAAPGSECTHWRQHHAEIHGLCVSALNGCRMCSELWRFFFKEKTPEQYLNSVPGGPPERFFPVGPSAHVFFGSGTSYRMTEQPNVRNDSVAVQHSQQPDEDVVLELEFSINSPMIYEVVTRHYILKKTSFMQYKRTLFMSGLLQIHESLPMGVQNFPDERWGWIRAWMADCTNADRHQLCSRALDRIASSSYLPTRVIEVAYSKDVDGQKRYRLLETANSAPKDHRYATLSHIWGSDQNPSYRTVHANYQNRIDHGVLRSDLPPCFQDAIDVAKQLAIPYIWIDSLCIIQDDDKDRPSEAGSMDRVYSNSFLNISATASSSSKDRLPSMAKDDRLQEPRFVQTAWSDPYPGIYQIFDPHFWPDRVDSTRLASRGWIFQERALAPRVLHFGFDQVLWECAESERAEELPHGIPLRSRATGREGFKWHLNMDPLQDAAANYGGTTILRGRAPMQHADLHKKWSTVLSQYTRCELTRQSDKLIAVSGVAKLLADRFEDTYVAGLWNSNLVGGLCWRVPQMRRTTQDLIPSGLYARRWEISHRLEGNGAPSWSWASVDGVIEAGPLESYEQVHDAFSEPSTGSIGYKTCSSVLFSAPKVDVVPKTDMNVFGEVDTERTRLELHGTTYPLELCPLESLGPRRDLTFRHYGTEAPLTICFDQPEESDTIKDAIFLSLIQIKHFVIRDPGTATAPTTRSAGRYHSAVHTALLSCFKRSANPKDTHTKKGGASESNTAVHRYDLDRVIGIVLAPVEGSEMFRRIGLHECQAQSLDQLRSYKRIVALR